jgi:putative ABC transport system permease protein
MRLSAIPRRSVQRHPWRVALLLLVVATVVAVVTSIHLVTRSAERDLADKVDAYGANIVVVPRSERLPLVYGGVHLGGATYEVQPLTMQDVALIRTIRNKANVNRVAPKLLQAAEVNGVRIAAVGVQWDEELGLKSWWRIVGAAPAADHDVLLGSRAGVRLGLAAGGTVTVSGERFFVTGVLESTGTQEDDVLFLDLATAQRLWARQGQVSFVEVSAWCSTCPIEDISAQISVLLPGAQVSALLKAVESRELLIGQFRLFGLALSIFLVLAGCLIVVSSTLAGVRERTGEIGVFRALGFRRRHVLQIVLLENLALALVGGSAGVGVAGLSSGPLARLLAGVPGGGAGSPVTLVAALGVAVAAVMSASVYPAWQASRLSPMLAMRSV